ncbi:MAG TPA: hypothetical protein VGM31_08440 [Puia sp.]|jgi:hypothetical protein
MDRWHGKHPIPWDFFYTFNDVTGKNLNWFWTNWFFSNNYIDLAIDKVEGNNVVVDNIGGFAIPFDVVLHYTDGSSDTHHQTPAIWAANEKMAQIGFTPAPGKKLLSLELKGGIYVDADITNNRWMAPN